MATHEECDKDGGCLNTPEDWKAYRASGTMPPLRYRHWIESDPVTQLSRLHALQVSGARNIGLGPGEAEVNANQTPQEASDELHRVAECCGYMAGKLSNDNGNGRRSVGVFKAFGPFRIEWDNGKLARIIQGDEKERVYWDAKEAW